MTNADIIISDAILGEVMTEEEIAEYLDETGVLPLNTYQRWKALGYQVKKGEKSVLTSYLWKFGKGEDVVDEETGEVTSTSKCWKRKSYLFSYRQVEPIVA